MAIITNKKGKKVVIVGGGREALKRINSALNQKCEITLISDKISKPIENLVKKKKIIFKNQKLENAKFLSKEKPFLVITTTDDKKLNQAIIKNAKNKGILAYSSDDSKNSDFSNPAIIDFENLIQIAVFTGGKSPAMSKKIKEQIEIFLKQSITKEDTCQIKIQEIARTLAKKKIDSQIQRKAFLKSIMNDNKIKQLIKEGEPEKAENRVVAMLRKWK